MNETVRYRLNVVAAAEKAMKEIVEAYLEHNRTLREMRLLAEAGELDFPLRFGEECSSHLAQSP